MADGEGADGGDGLLSWVQVGHGYPLTDAGVS
jgi:hypothetical protein